LVFEKNKKNEEIQFIVMPDADTAKKRFGLPRRASEYPQDLIKLKNILEKSKSKTLKYSELKNKSKFNSFQANRFITNEHTYESRTKLEMKRIGEFFEIIRAQHISKFGEETVLVEEITSSDIDETGLVRAGQINELSQEDISKYEKQILKENDLVICFRGAPDSVGKIGMYMHEDKKLVPNQSFMILRPKSDNLQSKMISKITFWWLRTKKTRLQLRQRSISSGVLRLTPNEIKNLEIPIGPNSFLEFCNSEFNEWMQKINLYEKIKKDAVNIEINAMKRSW
jgi:restriction endonuclease S subunit